MVALGVVRKIALEMPGAFETESYGGRPSWRTKPRMFAWFREDPEALVLWVESVEEAEVLVTSEPKKFFTTDHYDGHAMVLVNIGAIDRAECTELVIESWRQRANKTAVKKWDAEH